MAHSPVAFWTASTMPVIVTMPAGTAIPAPGPRPITSAITNKPMPEPMTRMGHPIDRQSIAQLIAQQEDRAEGDQEDPEGDPRPPVSVRSLLAARLHLHLAVTSERQV